MTLTCSSSIKVFTEDNSAKLRFEIDPSWYGELPRTYFFDKKHQRSGLSGVISHEKYNEKINTVLTSSVAPVINKLQN